MQALSPCIFVEMNQQLNALFTEQDVTLALFQMNLLEAPSPDGFLAHFFKKHWPNLKKELCIFALNVMNHHSSLDDVYL